jgi:sirohydrochlorin cobaltochelatase
MEKFGILLLGHGSSLPYNKKLVEETANILRKKHKITVHTAFLNMDAPSIQEALKELCNSGVNRIVALPLFLAHGVHTLQDMPAQLGIENGSRKATKKHGNNNIEILYAEPLGAEPVIAELAYQRAGEALEVLK